MYSLKSFSKAVEKRLKLHHGLAK